MNGIIDSRNCAAERIFWEILEKRLEESKKPEEDSEKEDSDELIF